MLPALLGIAGLGAGIYSAFSAQDAQKKANSVEMDFNSQQAELQRRWEQEMSNTAFQRSRKDLEAANMNPLLAFGHPASTPSGAVASAHPKSTGTEKSQLLSMVSKSASEVALTNATLKKVAAETKLSEAHAAEADQEAKFRTSGYGQALMMLRETLSALGGGLTGLGAYAGAKSVARAVQRQPKIYVRGSDSLYGSRRR